MVFNSIVILNIILAISINLHICYQYEESDDKLWLNAKELSNLLRSKQIKKKRTKVSITLLTTVLNLQLPNETICTERKNDELMLKCRKIWSRWGKWSECSVTCGEGTISRRRLCVSGRCAPGEFEEQQRPCNRQPCDCCEIVDDLHDRV